MTIRRTGAHVRLCTASALAATVHEVTGGSYDSILVHLREDAATPHADAAVLHLAGAPGVAPEAGARFTLVPGERQSRPAESLVTVPDFSDADVDALRDGLLPNSTDAGRSIGRVARSLCGLSVGVALGAGSVRGFAHFGVLRAFDKLEPAM